MEEFIIKDGVLIRYNGDVAKVTIPTGVAKIGNRAFSGYENIEAVKIPKTVTEIGDKAFEYCKSLKSISIPSEVTVIGVSAFAECRKLSKVTLAEGLREIGREAFWKCDAIKSLTIPASVKTIGAHAFGLCTSLKSLTILGNTKICDHAFMSNLSLRELNIPATLTDIGAGVFESCERFADEKGFVIVNGVLAGYCSADTNIVIPDGVTSIDDNVFAEYGVFGLGSAGMPKSVKHIGKRAFKGNPGLADKDGFVIFNGILFDYHGESTKVVVPASVTEISEVAFKACESLESVELPSTLTRIGASAFADCSALKSINLPDSLTHIDRFAFDSCDSLEKIIIPASVKEIGILAFQNCESLSEIIIEGDMPILGDSMLKGVTKLADKDGFVIFDGKLMDYIGEETNLVIPDSVKSFAIVSGFHMNQKTETVVIPEGITEIPDRLFLGWTSLKNVELPKSLKRIGMAAFGQCTSLDNVVIPDSVEVIDASAFKDCYSLSRITIPHSVRSIGEEAFYGCDSLKTVKIEEGVKYVQKMAFRDCDALESVNIPASVEAIWESVFDYCERCSISIRDLSVLPIEARPLAVAGFGKVFDSCSENEKQRYYDFMQANADNIARYVVGDPRVLGIMIDKGFVTEEMFDQYFAAADAIDKIESKALILSLRKNGADSDFKL